MSSSQTRLSTNNSSDSEGLADIGSRRNNDDNSNNSSSTAARVDQSWRQLLQESSDRSRHIRGSNYVQLATIDPKDGTPRCRTVVFRGFVDNIPAHHALAAQSCNDLPCVMKMITDARSAKVTEIGGTAGAAEMVWWFPHTAEQYRIRGTLQLVGPAAEDDDDAFLHTLRRETWEKLSDAAREAYYDSCMPGAPFSADAADAARAQIPTGGRNATTGLVLQPPPAEYLLLLLLPQACDYLQLGGATQQYRQVDIRLDKGTWKAQRVNP